MKKQKNKLAGLQKRKAISGYLFILPFIIGFLAFMVKPMWQSFQMSLSKVSFTTQGYGLEFVRLDNYIKAFTLDMEYNRKLWEEMMKMFINSLAVMVFSFFVALILNQKFHGRAFVRAVFFLPVIVSSGIIVSVEADNSLLKSVMTMVEESNKGVSITGAIEEILVTTGMAKTVFEKVFEIVDGIYDVAIASGIQIVIFLSGLQTISDSMYEAASIEGCTAWESLWKITFPMISSLFLVNWIYTIVDFCMKSSNEVMKKIETTMFQILDYGFASAMSWAYFAVVTIIIAVTAFIISKGVYYYD